MTIVRFGRTFAGFIAALSVALVAAQGQALAETRYPNKAVRIVLPFAAGGVADITARVIAERLGAKLDGLFYVENQ
ncbi:MAG TPA: tripartite tricarboxylate transporter substrate binding protein, partial [Bradyrhizobium sp.]